MKEAKLRKMNEKLRIWKCLSVALAFIFVFGCKTKKETAATKDVSEQEETVTTARSSEELIELPQNTSKTKQAILKNDSLFVTIERTVCFGKCPVYKMYVYNSGFVIYEGKMNVDKIGKFSTQLTKSELDSIKQRAVSVNYFELNDKYDGSVTDLPSVITSVALNGFRKTITARYNVPKELKEFQNFIDKVVATKDWILLGLSEDK